MKELVVALALMVVSVGAFAWWSHRSDAVLTRPPDANRPAAERPKPPEAKPKAKIAAKHVAADPPRPIAVWEPPAAAPAAPEGQQLLAPPPPLPFPAAAEITSGVEAEKVVEKYGEPALWTTAAGHQHILENLVYTRERGQVQTIIRLEDGKVSSVASDSRPTAVPMPPPATRTRH